MAERSALFRAAAIAGSVAASLNLAACGGGGGGDASSTAAPVPPPASPTPPSPAPAPGAAPAPATPPPPSPPSPAPSPVPPPAPPPGPPPPSLSLNPNAIERMLLNGEAKRFPIEVRLSGTLPSVVYVLVTDSGSAFNPTIALNCFSVDACDAIATTQSTLPLGTTTGALTARLCSDQACANQITSASIAYRFNVVAPGAQPPLTRLVGVDEWSTEQGNAAHTGYMPTTLDPAKFSVRWKWIPPNLPASGPNVLFWSGPMVSSSQKQLAYVAANVSDGSASRLYAVRETDGTLGWEVSYPPLVYPGPPAAYGERVYTVVLNGNGARDGQFLGYDATTGNYVFSTLFAAECPQGCWPGAPVVVDGIAYVNPGSNSVVGGSRPAASAFHAQSGGLLWSAATGGSAMQALAVDASRAYLYAPNSNVQAAPGFTALNKITGATEFGVPGIAAPIGAGQIYYQGDAPVLDGSGAAYFRLNRRSFDAQVQAVNLSTGQRLWESGGSSATVLAVADGAVFCANRELWALSTSDGKLLWVKWLPPMFAHTQMDRVLLTRNLIFVSTSEDVFAFDRVTRDLVWSFPIGGQISLSASGLLYVVAPTAVYAINLQ